VRWVGANHGDVIGGPQIGPTSDYREPADVCASCRDRWATWEVVDLLGVFDHDRLCDECAASVPREYEVLPYVPPSLDDSRS